ncbi:MAG: IS1634 family transposase [Acetobacteraceae bacterium]|nr:IS1634 family transposase [Acetobacteraceae bacterium]
MASFTWRGPAAPPYAVLNLGPLALMQPLVDQLDIEAIIDRHLPPDPRQEFSHGQVLRLLLLARLSSPTALVNVAQWAQKTGADILSNIPVDKLNDDRLGRALDAFFEHRHSILGSVTAQALQLSGLTLNRLHFDPTSLVLTGAYETAEPRAPLPPGQPLLGDASVPPAHITYGYNADTKMIQAGQLALVDELGAVPVFMHCLDGNRNGHPAIQQTFELAHHHLNLPEDLLLISDRGTCSVEHLARLHRQGYQALCAAQWQDYRALYDTWADQLHWQPASFLSVEQQRRRLTNSSLPQEHYEIAVRKHTLTDPTDGSDLPVRLIFVHSTADAREARQHREKNIAKMRAGFEQLQAKILRGHPQCTTASIQKQVHTLLHKRAAARYFSWRLVPLTPEERQALPAPLPGHRRATQRLEFQVDAAAAQADERYDGRSVLVTTAACGYSADRLFSMYKEQNYVETLHHQWKTPLAVSPVFLKSPRRVEALVCLLQIALQAYQVLERLYRQRVAAEAPPQERRMTSERLLRAFDVYGLLVRQTRCGRVVHPTRLSTRQRQILDHFLFPTPAQTLKRLLMPEPYP